VTTWVETPEGGRTRGPAGIARAWVEVLVRPRRFFTNGVAPGDQAPGLTFAIAVALAYVIGLLVVEPTTILRPDRIPILGGSTGLTVVLVLLLTAVAIAPAGLHLMGALQTVLLMLTVNDRAGVSETVQVMGYAAAPCALAWIPLPGMAALCALYSTGLLILGIAVVHRTSVLRATVAAAIPATLIFWVGFGGLAAGRAGRPLVG